MKPSGKETCRVDLPRAMQWEPGVQIRAARREKRRRGIKPAKRHYLATQGQKGNGNSEHPAASSVSSK